MRDRHAEFAVAFIDLDHFKSLNDTYGHETGDRALRSFARLLRRTVRDGDLICRYGGEEFVVVFPDATVREAWLKLTRENHPDRLTAQGMPPDFVEIATERMATINAAWDLVRKERGLR